MPWLPASRRGPWIITPLTDHCEVKPGGENHGESLAKIGNILEYGRSNMPARPWFNPTVEQATGEVTQAMQAAFDQAQKG